MPRGNRTASPSTCDTSDLIQEIVQFVETFPDWSEDMHQTSQLGLAIKLLVSICPADDVTQEEMDYVCGLRATITERFE
jgi:hypothetical protein